jgi:hypothetical protein
MEETVEREELRDGGFKDEAVSLRDNGVHSRRFDGRRRRFPQETTSLTDDVDPGKNLA